MKSHTLILTFITCAVVRAQAPDPIGFVEQWVLAKDRAKALEQLIPGIEDYYFYHALHYQHSDQKKEYTATIKAWDTAIQQKKIDYSPRYRVMKNRGVILDQQDDPKENIRLIRELLALELDHQRVVPPEDAVLPSKLDPAAISAEAFVKETASDQHPYRVFEDHMIYQELKQVEKFDRAKRLWFLNNIHHAAAPETAKLFLAELKHKTKPSFADVPGHQLLMLEQLRWLENQHPPLLEQGSFFSAVIARMRPGDAHYLLHHPEKKKAWLSETWEYVSSLSPVHNSLKAHILYHLLDHHRTQGEYPEQLLMAYLAIPRGSSTKQVQMRNTKNAASLRKDYSKLTTLPPVRRDQELIRDYLLQTLAKKSDVSDYAKLLPEKFLTALHAEAQLLAGADASTWGEKLTPADFQALRDRTEVRLALQNKRRYAANDDVALKLELKHVAELNVQIYEIDALAHIQRSGSDPSVEIELNGLVPHHKFTQKFDQSPLRRHQHTLKLPQLEGRGIWIVECISRGVSCRALIKKGSLQMLVSNTADAQLATVLDENQKPVHPAQVWLQGKAYPTNKNGMATIPLASSPRTDQAILHVPGTSGLAESATIRRKIPNYTLSLQAATNREQLLAGKKANLLIRPRLSNNGKPIAISQLQKTSLHITAKLRAEISTQLTADNFTFSDQAIHMHAIAIPEDVRSITVTLNGEVKIPGRSEPTQLTASASMRINSASDTHLLSQPLLSITEQGWVIELLGRNGEPMPKRALTLELYRSGFSKALKRTLRTDAEGKIHLGALDEIHSIDIEATDYSTSLSAFLTTHEVTFATTFHTTPGERIQIPVDDPSLLKNIQENACLYRHHGDPEVPAQKMNQHLSTANGMIIVKGLAPGDYALRTAYSGTTYTIRVVKGQRNGIWLSDGSRSLEYQNSALLQVSNIQADEASVSGSIQGATPKTHLLVIGTRYYHDDYFDLLHQPSGNSLLSWKHGFSGNEWLNGRQLSDEYRYILERRQAEQFPGNMLPRPGLILNRWKQDESNEVYESGAGMFNGKRRSERKPSTGGGGDKKKGEEEHASHTASYDFLAYQSVIRSEVKLAKDGTFSVPLKDFAHCQNITVLAYNADQISSRTLPLTAKKRVTRERRLDRNLDPQKHYTGSRATAILKQGATAEIKNVLDADWRAYTSLGHVHDYFHTNRGSDELRAFAPLMQWPKLNEKQRSGAAHLLASHEFHLFAYFKDRAWFDENIQPMLSQKRHRTFIDDFLLGSDLQSYLKPWKYQKLNAAEKALLARALPEQRDAIVKDLRDQFERNKPTPEEDTIIFASALRQNSLALRDRLGLAARDLSALEHAERSSAGVEYVQQKLNNIIIPVVDFENTTLSESLNFLRLRTRELDTEPDPARKGIHFTIRGTQLANTRIKQMRLRNIPVDTLLQYICDSTRTRYRLTPQGVEISTLDALEVADLYTRSIVVPPDFLAKMSNADEAGSSDDPFGGSSDNSTLNARASAKEILQRNGVAFPDGASVVYIPRTSTLIVRNTAGNVDIIEQITRSLRMSGPPRSETERLTARNTDEDYRGRAPLLPSAESMDSDPFGAAPELPEEVGVDAFGDHDLDAPADAFPVTPATPVEPEGLLTSIWSESHYYRHPNLKDGPNIYTNRFWIELAAHDGKSPFLSARFPECTDSTASMLIALAVLDLPFEGEKPEAQVEKLSLKVTAKSRMLLFYRDTRETNRLAENSPLLVQQKFFRHGDRTRTDASGQKVENPVTGEFLAGVPYTASFIITNPTGTARELQVLTQIPRGSIPLGKSPETSAREISLDAHSTLRTEYSFYFPAAGTYPHFPAHVIERGTVLAFAKPAAVKVLDHDARRDTRSLNAIARDGTEAAVLAHLEKANLHQISLRPIQWRLSNKSFYKKVITLLQRRLYYDADVYVYGFKHSDPTAVTAYLKNSDIAIELGASFTSRLITVDNRERGAWEHLEFAPLINPRQHRFQGNYQILNSEVLDQYLNVLDAIAWKAAPSQDDLLTLAYQLFLQDRVSEALEVFERVKRDQTEAQMQYDYMHCYALFYQGKAAEAAVIAAKWKGVKSRLWQQRFTTVRAQAAEIAGMAQPEKKTAKPVTVATPSLEIRSEGEALAFEFSSIQKVTLRLYAVDLEVLFSENPFLDKHSDLNPPIRPNHISEIEFPDGKNKHLVTLPEDMRLGNVLAMAESGDMHRVLALDSQAIKMTRDVRSRTLRISSAKNDQPLPRSYVKIYIETTDGETQFFKDGYTDLRGLFPYEKHTRIAPHEIKRYAIFTSHPKFGSKIQVTK